MKFNETGDSKGYVLLNENSVFNTPSPSFQKCLEEIADLSEPEKTPNQEQISPGSLQLLRSYDNTTNKLNTERIVPPAVTLTTVVSSSNKLSAEKIMRIAGERFIQSFSETTDVVSMLDNPFNVSLLGLSDEDTEKVELAQLLLSAAEKVGHKLYNSASILLNYCDELSSFNGNVVERVVFYFSKALRERIDRKTEKAICQGPKRQQLFNIEEAIMTPSPNLVSLCKELPFPQIAHCVGTQAIIENVTGENKIHIIDLGIKIGLQWAGLMQSLASESVYSLKITAVGTTTKQQIENTGKRLTSFAESIGLPFSFNIVMISNMLELNEDLFGFEASETVVVYSSYLLMTLILIPETLEHIMKVIRILSPRVMMVVEPELNTTSQSFSKRFVETIFYYSAYFDCLDHFLRDHPNRENIESLLFGEAIRSILATDGDDRDFCHVTLDAWRAFFARFGMVETQMSQLSLYHGEQTAKRFDSGNDCTFEMDGKSLLIGWKGTPLISFSAWKFRI